MHEKKKKRVLPTIMSYSEALFITFCVEWSHHLSCNRLLLCFEEDLSWVLFSCSLPGFIEKPISKWSPFCHWFNCCCQHFTKYRVFGFIMTPKYLAACRFKDGLENTSTKRSQVSWNCSLTSLWRTWWRFRFWSQFWEPRWSPYMPTFLGLELLANSQLELAL